MRARIALPLATVASGAAGIGYASLIERNAFRVRRFEVPVLAPGERPLRILHMSDAHLTPARERLCRFISSLADLEPDFVVNTGDNLAVPEAVPALVDAMRPLLRFPGAFVLASHDYYGSRLSNVARYLRKGKVPYQRTHGLPLPWEKMREAFTEAGWADCTNARARIVADGRAIHVGGVGDAHIERDSYPDIAGPVDPDADLALGLLHAPEPRLLDDFVSDGYRLLLAGHTHGGQLRVPFFGALVTNCGLDRKRARGLHRWGLGLDPAYLHVSAGLGTSPHAPVRFSCPPEATLLTLTPRLPAPVPAVV